MGFVVSSELHGRVTPHFSGGLSAVSDRDDGDAALFGRLVRAKRVARGWSLEALAADAFLNADRKGYASRIENGKIRKISHDTVRKIARALQIDPEEIPTSLRWPEANAAARGASAVALKIEDDIGKIRDTVDRLVASAQLIAPIQLGSLIKKYRLKNSLTQKELAFLIYEDETKFNLVSDIERGLVNINADIVGRFIFALNIKLVSFGSFQDLSVNNYPKICSPGILIDRNVIGREQDLYNIHNMLSNLKRENYNTSTAIVGQG